MDETKEQPRMDQEPSWLNKLMGKMKKSFCLKLDLQDRAYEAHKKEKNARRCQKEIMTKLDLPVSSGSKKSITPKEKWISVACRNAYTEGEFTPPLLFGKGRGRHQHHCRWIKSHEETHEVFYPGSGHDDRVIPYVLHVWIDLMGILSCTMVKVSRLPGSC
jgi:hypothetical protein